MQYHTELIGLVLIQGSHLVIKPIPTRLPLTDTYQQMDFNWPGKFDHVCNPCGANSVAEAVV